MAEISLKILVVDDSIIMRRIISSLLAKMGHTEVLEAPTTLHALKILDSERIDFVISDYSMPGQNGLELLTAMHHDPRRKDIPLIMVTAEAQLSHIVAAFRAGAQHYVTKPFSAKYLEYVINKVMGFEVA